MREYNYYKVWVLLILLILIAGCSDGVGLSGRTADADGNCYYMGGSEISPIYFAAGTQVLMADGSSRDICVVEKGDKVIGYDFFRDKSVDLEVARRASITCETCLLVNGSIRVNCRCPFYPAVGGRIIHRKASMDVGSLLGDTDGNANTLEKVYVTRIDTVSFCEEYYDLKFSQIHTFFIVDDGGNRYLVKTSPPPSALYSGWN